MKKFFIIAAISSLSLLGGCDKINNLVTDPTKLQELETQVQQTAVQICGFLPAVEAVAGILKLNNPLLAAPDAIANAICNAVKPQAASAKGLAPRGAQASAPVAAEVAGVTVTGRFVK